MAALGALLLAPLAQAQEGGQAAPNPQPWRVNCSSQVNSTELACVMSQTLVAANTNQRVIAATIFRSGADKPATLRIGLPHGILLQEGLEIWIDEGARSKLPITIADQNGSYANLELGGTTLVALQGGSVLHLGVKAGNGEPVEFQLSLAGFTAAFAKL